MEWATGTFQTTVDLIGPNADVSHVMFQGDAGCAANVLFELAKSDDVLLATHANDKVLEPKPGYPLRSVVPRRYA